MGCSVDLPVYLLDIRWYGLMRLSLEKKIKPGPRGGKPTVLFPNESIHKFHEY